MIIDVFWKARASFHVAATRLLQHQGSGASNSILLISGSGVWDLDRFCSQNV
jgi:hypothetical protein